MPDHVPHPEPEQNQVAEDLAALSELTAAGIEVDGEVQVAESTWLVYGHTSYDGEVVVGEYHDAAEAAAVLRAAPHPDTDPAPRPGPSPRSDPGPDHDADADDPRPGP